MASQLPDLPKQDANLEQPLRQDNSEPFTTYHSTFDWYPLLRTRSRPLAFFDGDNSMATNNQTYFNLASSLSSISTITSPTIPTLPSSSISRSRSSSASSVQSDHPLIQQASPTIPLPDLKDLKLATLSRFLDPSKRICQYEVPGGGICRDDGCEDIHLSRMGGGVSAGRRGSGAPQQSRDGVEPSGASHDYVLV